MSEFSQGEVTLMAVASFLYQVAISDGELDEREDEFIRQDFRKAIVARGETITEARLDECLYESKTSEQLQHIIIEHARQYPEYKTDLLRYGWRILAFHGRITEADLAFMTHIAGVFDVSDDELAESAIPYIRFSERTERLARARWILGVDADASMKQIGSRFGEISQSLLSEDRSLDDGSAEIDEDLLNAIDAYDFLTKSVGDGLFVLAPVKGEILSAKDVSLCRCFFCDKRSKRPPLEALENARCSECQTLLAFEKDWAESFL